MATPRVAFLGLGIMGSRMARRLLNAGLALTLYNRDAAKAAPFAASGATVAPTPRQAAAGAELVMCIVADDTASRGIWLGENGALAGASAGTVLVESSTVSPGWIRELAAAAKQRQCEVLDAPVTGSKPHAEAGELNFLVGGSENALQVARPVLQHMSRSITHLGPTGSGAIMKLINNFVCAAQVAGLAEGMAMIERTELNRDQAVKLLVDGAAGSPIVKWLSARMAARDYTPNFLLRLMAKDVRYAIQEAAAHSLALDTAKTTLAIFERAIQAGHGDKDFAAIIEPLRSS